MRRGWVGERWSEEGWVRGKVGDGREMGEVDEEREGK